MKKDDKKNELVQAKDINMLHEHDHLFPIVSKSVSKGVYLFSHLWYRWRNSEADKELSAILCDNSRWRGDLFILKPHDGETFSRSQSLHEERHFLVQPT